MLRLTAKIICGLPLAALVLYLTTGVGMLGPRALAVNHTLADKAMSGFMNVAEGYFRAHPLIPDPSQVRPVQTPPTRQ